MATFLALPNAASAPQHAMHTFGNAAGADVPSTSPDPAGSLSSPWSCTLVAAVAGAATGFRHQSSRRRIALRAKEGTDGKLSRSDLLRTFAGTVGGLSMPSKVSAKSQGSVTDIKEDLKTYGTPELTPSEEAPAGWTWVAEPIGITEDAYNGKFNLGAVPRVLRFLCPPGWLAERPNIDYNGAAGTVQINDYSKGDACTFYADLNFAGNVEDLKKKDCEKELAKALTQKGKSFLQGIKVSKVEDGPAPGYKTCEYEYTIYSGAGFELERSGVAVLAQLPDTKLLNIFWSAASTSRYKDVKSNLKTVMKSFRIAKVPAGIKVKREQDDGKEFIAYDVAFRDERFEKVARG